MSDCPIDADDFLTGESVHDTDIVLWVHAGTEHEGEPGGIAQDCSTFGPTLKVIGANIEAPATSNWDRGLLILLLMAAGAPHFVQWRRAQTDAG